MLQNGIRVAIGFIDVLEEQPISDVTYMVVLKDCFLTLQSIGWF